MKNASLSGLNLFIKDINKSLFGGDITEIIEVTYTYKHIGDSLNFNTTLFTEFGGYIYREGIDLSQIHQTVTEKLTAKIEQVDIYIQDLAFIVDTHHVSGPDSIRCQILKGTLVYVRNALEMALYGLPFELEKAGYNHGLSDVSVQKIIQKLASLETENFGGTIHDNPGEVALCYEFLHEKYDKAKGDKKQSLKYFLEKIEPLLANDYLYTPKKKKKKKKMEDIFDTLIDRDDYVEIFNVIFEVYGLSQRAKVTGVSSIYDGEVFLEIPDRAQYQQKTLKSILKLTLHEIMAHSVNLENTKRRLGNFRGPRNLEKEEGLAVILEKIFEGHHLEDISIVSSLPSLLIGEICSTEDFQKYIELMYPDLRSAFFRFKRNYPMHYSGVQHKDTSYSRGILKVRDFLLDGGDMQDLFIGKVSFEDIPLLKQIPLKDESEQQIPPLLISEFLYFIIKGKGVMEIDNASFMSYLGEKYKFINLDKMDISYRLEDIEESIHRVLVILKKYLPYIELNDCYVLCKIK